MSALGAVAGRELVEATPLAGPGFPLPVGPVWARRLQALQSYPGRWGRWRGRATVSARASVWAVGRHSQGLAGTYTFRTSLTAAGEVLVCVRWTPPADPAVIDLRPAASAAEPAPGDGSRRPSEDGPASRPPPPGAGSTPHATPPAPPAPPCARTRAPEPNVGTAHRPAPAPLLKCGGCWRRFADPQALADHEASHARAGAEVDV